MPLSDTILTLYLLMNEAMKYVRTIDRRNTKLIIASRHFLYRHINCNTPTPTTL